MMHMVTDFFKTTGELFPYIDEDAFLRQCEHLNSAPIRAMRRSWLGLLNMVLALSTSASHDNVSPGSDSNITYDVFYRRTWVLCEKEIRYGSSLEVGQ